MNLDLAAAVAHFVYAADAESAERLRRFSWLDWKRADFWLDTSGLALPFIHRLEALSSSDVLPSGLVRRLRRNLADNRVRAEGQFQQFCRVNRALAHTHLSYAVHKGFSSIPDFCPDPALRAQYDFDFYVDPSDFSEFDIALRALGYSVVGTNAREARYDTHPGQVARRRDIYSQTDRSCVELHLDYAETHGGRFVQANGCVHHLLGATFPVLSKPDRLMEHANHILTHARTGWVRTSWLLEWLTVAKVCRTETALWSTMRSKGARPPVMAALGFATELAAAAFDVEGPAELAWTSAGLPLSLRRWLQRYGREFALTPYPGSKLQLLAAREFDIDAGTRRKTMLPLHKPNRPMFSSSRSPWKRIEAALAQSRFLAQRTAFHLKSNLRYWRESRRWRAEAATFAD